MPTKDLHVAVIDAHEELHQIKMRVKATIALVQQKAAAGTFSADDRLMIKAIKAEAIDAARRVQDRLYEELESHGGARAI